MNTQKKKAATHLQATCDGLGLTRGNNFYVGEVQKALADLDKLTGDQLRTVANLVRAVAFRIAGCDGKQPEYRQEQAVAALVREHDEIARENARYQDDMERFEARGQKCEHCGHDHAPGTRCSNQYCLCDTTDKAWTDNGLYHAPSDTSRHGQPIHPENCPGCVNCGRGTSNR